MSADLWAAFSETDDLSKNPWNQSSPTQATPTATQILQNVKEGASSSQHPPSTRNEAYGFQAIQSPWSTSHTISQAHQPSLQSQSQIFDRLTDTADTQDDIWSGWESPTVSAKAWAVEQASDHLQPAQSSRVETANKTDDWGDFEDPPDNFANNLAGLSTSDNPAIATSTSNTNRDTKPEQTLAAQEALQQKQQASIKSVTPSSKTSRVISKEISKAYRNGVEAIQPSQSGFRRSIVSANEQNLESEDEWDQWSPEPAASPATLTPRDDADIDSVTQSKSKTISESMHEAVPAKTFASPQKSVTVMPPTNVPPPSILISLISGLVEKLPEQIDSAIQNLPQSTGYNKALEPALQKCLAALRVAARVIAGRKLRWKRDTHLAQSMRIGQAGKGMKLSGIDRNEVKREDREAAEFVQVWQKRLGGIRRALALVNSQVSGSPLALPEVSETMLIRTAKLVDGGITAPKCCVLCGIKRDERVEKVDGNVYDSFSEWWTEHWGHTDCKIFWDEHERYLQQR